MVRGHAPEPSVAQNCPCRCERKGAQVVELREIVVILEVKRQDLGVSAGDRARPQDCKGYFGRGLETPVYGPGNSRRFSPQKATLTASTYQT